MAAPKEYYQFQAQLKQAAADWFAEQGYATRQERPDVLPIKADWPKNIILPEVAEYIQENVQNKDIHKHANSGLSSQAMAFNLIGPLIVRQDLSPLQIACERAGIPWPEGKAEAVFEFEDPAILSESSARPTSVDIAIQDQNGEPFLFIEAKMTEVKFGGCGSYINKKCEGLNPTDDLSLCYLHERGRPYWQLMLEHGYHEGVIGKMDTCVLIEHYQFFRNALMAAQTGKTFVVLHDARSPIFEQNGQGLIQDILQLMPESQRHQIKSLSVQQILAAIKDTGGHAWVDDFERKYGLGDM